jgi:hypothetical protein
MSMDDDEAFADYLAALQCINYEDAMSSRRLRLSRPQYILPGLPRPRELFDDWATYSMSRLGLAHAIRSVIKKGQLVREANVH